MESEKENLETKIEEENKEPVSNAEDTKAENEKSKESDDKNSKTLEKLEEAEKRLDEKLKRLEELEKKTAHFGRSEVAVEQSKEDKTLEECNRFLEGTGLKL